MGYPLESGLGRSSKGVAVIKGVPAKAQQPARGVQRGGNSKKVSVAAHLGGFTNATPAIPAVPFLEGFTNAVLRGGVY